MKLIIEIYLQYYLDMKALPWKSLESCFEAEGLLFLGRGWGLLRQGATVSILNQTTNGSILFSCHLPSHVTEVENDIPTGNGIFFFSERGCHDLNSCDSPNITYWNIYSQVDSFSRWELRDMIRSWSGVTVFLKWPPGTCLVLHLMG